jgi:hypothetical protein
VRSLSDEIRRLEDGDYDSMIQEGKAVQNISRLSWGQGSLKEQARKFLTGPN